MFTGIVEEIGRVVLAGRRLLLSVGKVGADSEPGASVAVNGVCLTVAERASDGKGWSLSFDLSDETLSRSALGRLRAGDPVNVERPLTLIARLGGHLVQGHVDGVARVTSVEPLGDGVVMNFDLPGELERYVVEKGSIAVDGVSLTVTDRRDGRFAASLVPFTLEATTLGSVRPGDMVNLEVDVLAKYVESLSGRSA